MSGDEQIEVKVDKDRVWKLDETTGFLRWAFTLPPGERSKAAFGYTVKYPKGRVVRLE